MLNRGSEHVGDAKANLAAGDGAVANRDVCDDALATHHVAAPARFQGPLDKHRG